MKSFGIVMFPSFVTIYWNYRQQLNMWFGNERMYKGVGKEAWVMGYFVSKHFSKWPSSRSGLCGLKYSPIFILKSHVDFWCTLYFFANYLIWCVTFLSDYLRMSFLSHCLKQLRSCAYFLYQNTKQSWSLNWSRLKKMFFFRLCGQPILSLCLAVTVMDARISVHPIDWMSFVKSVEGQSSECLQLLMLISRLHRIKTY